jgi:valyl-tRNA synthetase
MLSPSPEGEGLNIETSLGKEFGQSLLARHYPGDVLVSGFDILFFWDARMIMQGLHFMKQESPLAERVPFKTLYLHGLVRAADGSKMSKSKGNTVDPLGLIDQYGADALRFFMAAMESQGRDIKMDESRVAGYRNFATKLWNAARFAQSNGIGGSHSVAAPKAELAVNKWIIGEVVECLEKLNKAFAEFRFDGMADTIYHFVWDEFCDWYLELIKPVLNPPRNGEVARSDRGGPAIDHADHNDKARPLRPLEGAPPRSGEDLAAAETRAVAGWVLDQILVMLHPFMPFITEELWHSLGEREYDLIHAKWPKLEAEVDSVAKNEIGLIVAAVSNIRTKRTEANIPPSTRMEASVAGGSNDNRRMLASNFAAISKLARINWSDLPRAQLGQDNTLQVTVRDMTIALQLEGAIDLDAERARITKAIEAATKERDALAGRLSNAAFVEKAKPEAVAKAKADHAEKAAEVERLQAALKRLG